MTSQEASYFYQLILMFETAALQQLGKLINPLTGKIEKDLGQAKFSIDMLGMIEEKTKGNLTPEERGYLQRVLAQLRLNYVEEANKAKSESSASETKEDKTT